MRIPTSATASDSLLGLGRFHLAALAQSEGTTSLASAFKTTYDALDAARTARALAEEALTAPRVAAHFAEFKLEKSLRQLALLAHAADNNTTGGPAFKALFPNGLDPELRPVGAAQVAAASAVRDRLDTQPAAASVKGQAMDDFDKALSALGTALEARRAAETKVSQARAIEDGARVRFVAAYDSNAGAIRQMFPRDRDQQDLHFDEFRSSKSSSSSKGGNSPTPAAPSGTS